MSDEQQPSEREKAWARGQVAIALRAGRLERKPCQWVMSQIETDLGARGASTEKQLCGVSRVQAHHPDYSKPLEVEWLCAGHHRRAHTDVKAVPKPLQPGTIISLRQFRTEVAALDIPVFVARSREVIGAWIPGWMIDELDLRGGTDG